MRESIKAVVETLFEAILLVVIVVMVFLQTWRASIIPLVAVPVSLVGTFAVMLGLGFSLNTLSLFGLVLAIGIVVDDAIVVVENVERHIELGATPARGDAQGDGGGVGPDHRDCAGAVRGVRADGVHQRPHRAVLPAVRADDRDLDGDLGVQLADAEPGAGVAAAAAARRAARSRAARRSIACSAGSSGCSTASSRGLSNGYAGGVARVLRVSVGGARASTSALIGLTVLGFQRVPQGFVPPQDKDYLIAFAQLPDAATLDRTEDVIRTDVGDRAEASGRVATRWRFPGLSINGFVNASNAGIVFVILKPADERHVEGALGRGHRAGAESAVRGVQEAFVAIFPPPPVQGIGQTGGFKLYVEDRGGAGFEELYAKSQSALGQGYQTPSLAGLFSSFQVNVPQIDTRVDRERAKTYGVPLTDVFDTLQVYLGSLYANDFNRFGRTYQVNVQAESAFRLQPEQIGRLKTRNARGDMVPLGSLVTVERGHGPDQVMHYNGYPAAEINGAPAPGFSSGQAQEAIAQRARAEAAARLRLRVDRARVSGKARRQHDDLHLPAVRAARLRRARGAVRELVAAAHASS